MNSPLITPRHITSQILLAVLVPVIILTCIITAYYSYSRYQEIEHTQVQMGSVTTSYLAQAAELGVYAGDLLALRDLADATLDRAAVNGIYFLDSSAELLLKKGDVEHVLGASELDRQQLVLVSDDNNLHFARPMLSKPVDIEDFYLSGAARSEAGRQTDTIGWVVLSLSRDEMRTQVYQMLYTALLVALGSILIGILIALKAGSAIGQPVRELSAYIKQLDKTKSPMQFKARGTVETIVLSKGINNLVSNIDSQIRDQQRQIKQATEDLTGRNQQLQDAHQVLEQALQAKEDFLARMSHELRTPLTTIMGFNRLASNAVDREQAQEYSRHIEHASELLSSIINDILDYSKMQSAKLALETIAFNIEDCFEDVVGMHGHEAVSKQVELVFLIDADVPVNVIGDPQRLQQIVNNLLSNAFRFTERGEIIVRLTLLQKRQDSAILHCEVRDSGIGIASEEQQRVFQAFTQADNSITRKHGGTGLGLTISRALVQMMHGEIALDSAPGRGTTVVFSFSVGLDSASGNDSGNHARGECSSPVLAYDSNDWSRRALRTALLNWSLDVAVYSDPAELLSRLRGSDPSAMLVLSLRHDEARADSLVALLRQIRDTYPGPIIVLSPIPELEQQLGANIKLDTMRFALKPMRRSMLALVCEQLVQRLDSSPCPIIAAPKILRGVKLLVAEDHHPIRELLKRILEAAGAVVDCVGDGSEAVTASMEHSYELMLMDLHMPGMDGISATQSIRGQGCTTPIVCLTADINAHQDSAVRDAGVNAVMLKPIEEDKLLQLVCRLCRIAYQADTQSTATLTPIADEQLKATMSQLLADGRSAFDNKDLPRYQALLHDMLGLAGLYQEKMLHEMIREIKIEGFALSPEEAQHLFDEIAILIQKY